MTRARLIDVAHAAGVSVGTASDALAGKNRIPEETRARVRAAAAELGYVPNRVARALQAGHLPLIGLVVPALRQHSTFDAYHSFWVEVIGTTTVASAERGYAVSVLPGFADSEFTSLPLAGLIVLDGQPGGPEAAAALNMRIPLATDEPDTDAAVRIRWDYPDSVAMVMDHFVEHGATRPAMALPDLDIPFTAEMATAHDAWCATHGMPTLRATFDPADPDSATRAEDSLIAAGADALYLTAPDRSIHLGDIATRHSRGLLRVLLAVLDDDAGGLLEALRITTVHMGVSAVMERTTEALVAAATHGGDGTVEVVAKPRLWVRASTLPLPHWDGIERRRSAGSA